MRALRCPSRLLRAAFDRTHLAPTRSVSRVSSNAGAASSASSGVAGRSLRNPRRVAHALGGHITAILFARHSIRVAERTINPFQIVDLRCVRRSHQWSVLGADLTDIRVWMRQRAIHELTEK